jgi:predicted transcriptional regulator
MKIALDIGASRGRAIDVLAKAEKRSRASIVREALGDYLAWRRERTQEVAFGLWGDHKIDGLDYQKKMRGSW